MRDTQTPDGEPNAGPGPSWPLVLPLTLLVILGLAGLRGAVTAPRWNGPLRHDGPGIGLALEVILGVLLVLTYRRRSRAMRAPPLAGAPADDVAAKLRGVLILVLGTGMIAVAVAIFLSLHLHLGGGVPPKPSVSFTLIPTPKPLPRGPQPGPSFHVPLTVILYVLLVVLLVAAVLLSVWWSWRFRPSFRGRVSGFLAEDPEDLREAVESGRLALRTVDDARAAIIACYVAMETSLAERGAARAVADTPDELLARARASGLVHGTAAARLTALFYEARFSSHPLGRGQRDAAEQALDELAAALASPEEAAGEAKATP
ncbi:MAG TPA: DUF4129 domain-containing protein [Streptosporangiaceae bacterium]|nr:DUF4129 domain-containing protein [Streptosporangiaceae bacterium]